MWEVKKLRRFCVDCLADTFELFNCHSSPFLEDSGNTGLGTSEFGGEFGLGNLAADGFTELGVVEFKHLIPPDTQV